jgi:uncharacterized membrane protein
MVAAGAFCALFGVLLVVCSFRPARGSELGSISGDSRGLAVAGLTSTGLFLIAMAIALILHDVGAVLDILILFGVLYSVATVMLLASLLGGWRPGE